ncbi:TPA: DUF4065 domain-containing protein [Candidatus Scatenecus faecavium]|uniref:DUF4065 domain-containing protein n=1 Tax=Candidatus Scatenecus faecavium TaxID=2840915 RepID=A0A9D1FW78_9BACT|nr:DUF4065 domain-containing protein [Candidatus Scatenecus faecavium]
MTYYVTEIAKYIITYCSNKKRPISNLKLQKLLYFLWIDYFKKNNCSLFNENICAWQFGPVVPEVYYEFCSYAGSPINKIYDIVIYNQNDSVIINNLIDKYIEFSASKLVEMTHKAFKPWSIIYNNGAGLRNIIPFDLIVSMECQ